MPRDRDGTFEPNTVRKRQRRLEGVDAMVLSLCAKGLTTEKISAHLADDPFVTCQRCVPMGTRSPAPGFVAGLSEFVRRGR